LVIVTATVNKRGPADRTVVEIDRARCVRDDESMPGTERFLVEQVTVPALAEVMFVELGCTVGYSARHCVVVVSVKQIHLLSSQIVGRIDISRSRHAVAHLDAAAQRRRRPLTAGARCRNPPARSS